MNLKVSDLRLFFFLINKGGGFGGGRSLILFFLKMIFYSFDLNYYIIEFFFYIEFECLIFKKNY